MSELIEYVVSTHEGVTIDELESQLTAQTSGLDPIPDREVEIANPRPLNERQTHFLLTEEEVVALREHPDVLDVSRPPNELAAAHCGLQSADFNRGTVSNGSYVNWGLRRVNQQGYEATPGTDFTYNLDGTGVDIIIQDNGTMAGHPEWEDANGVTRFIQHDWYAVTGTAGTMPTGHYGNVGPHGSHVTGIAAGKTYGWAKNARIYSMRYDLMSGFDAFDLIRIWHNQKPVDPRTGIKRPTIVNASWGYRWYYDDGCASYGIGCSNTIKNVSYRGGFSGPIGVNGTRVTASGQVNSAHNFTYTALNVAVKQMTDAGVIYVKAAGNYYHKTDSNVTKLITTSSGNLLTMKHTLGVAVGHSVTAVLGATITAGTTVTNIVSGKQISISNAPTITSSTYILNFKGPDYDNYYQFNNLDQAGMTSVAGDPVYYHRPGSPTSLDTINVGCVYYIQISGQEARAYFSEHGPGIDVYAPGSYIQSATSNGADVTYSPVVYPPNNSYRSGRISGTSMAAPQVTGLLACYLSVNPTATAEDCKEWLANIASTTGTIYNPGSIDDWSNNYSPHGGVPRYLKNPYTATNVLSFKSS
jgi:subtilisin family serine protease